LVISIVALLIIGLVYLKVSGRAKKILSPSVSLVVAFVLAGILFGEDSRFISYGLMGTGIVLAIIEFFKNSKMTNEDIT